MRTVFRESGFSVVTVEERVFCESGFSVVTVGDSVLRAWVQCGDCGGQCSVSLGSVWSTVDDSVL